MRTTRRSVLKNSLVVASTLVLPKHLRAASVNDSYQNDVDHAALADKFRSMALNEARRLRCDYADVRFSYQRTMKADRAAGFSSEELLGVSVRVLINGYWGFCCTPFWNEQSVLKAVALAHNQAKGNSQGPPREIDTAAYTAPGESGEWIMPIAIDPFKKNPYEFIDYLYGIHYFLDKFPSGISRYSLLMKFNMEHSWFGATNGATQYQRRYLSQGQIGFWVSKRGGTAYFSIETLPPSGLGYELFTGQDLYTQLRAGYDETLELTELETRPIDVGRYPIVLTGFGTADLLGTTLGGALELDRIVGVDANAGGTSFIQNVSDEIGQFKFGHPSMTVDYQRDEAGAAGTRRWDDEGTPCSKGRLIEGGVVKRVFSGKEMAVHLQSSDQLALGNAIAPDPTIMLSVRPSNMVMHPDTTHSGTVNDLIKDIDRGFFFRKSQVGLDFQMISGMITGEVYEIRRGELTSRISGAGCWFKSTELWKNIEVIGSARTLQRNGITISKGQPPSWAVASTTAPAVVFKDATIIDTSRK